MTLEVNGTEVSLDNEGFLLYPEEWDMQVANALATRERIDMSDDHWTVVYFVRGYFEERQTVPEARHALKALREKLGKEKASRKFLYSLFPYGYGQQACKIAGMRKPLKLMLDI
ncbi:tRNA 2-thiouridine synthesizing protein E [Thiogranum longum]|uniref:Sulfurtransferase n=1 Tax=Thiogranum longum TaxID=1537524 RepID=A0A4R1H762_9GAMM|nr:TusE/DsrC/DsvC family sulfur relay protein [Thiogranum longum]TCK17644.1 tRNA 2-thiouridine synthesizing protein E [Thiogranum longum]